MELFEVGGCVRDEILGIRSNDIDFSVVLDPSEVAMGKAIGFDAFEQMERELRSQGFELFEQARKPEHLTARGKFPKSHPVYGNKAADFVLARKDGAYSDGRRPDSVEVGTLDDDLARRDFTMNAIAKAADGSFIDPFNGQADIANRLIRAVGDPRERVTEDALRALRAVRFHVTKGFRIDDELNEVIDSYEVADIITNRISDERIQVELSKMFRFDTRKSLDVLSRYFNLTDAIFDGSVSLDATMKQKGRGK